MSFLLSEDEHATLEAALAFLDSCTSDDSLSTADCSSDLDADWITQEIGSSSSSDELWPSAGDQIVHSSSADDTNRDDNSHDSACAAHRACVYSVVEPDDRPTAPQKSNRRLPTVSSRVRKRVIDEIFTLRERVVQLTARRNQLEKRGGVSVASPSRGRALSDNQLSSDTQRRSSSPKADECVISIKKKALAYSDAVHELQKLHKSEAENRKLRAAWRQQIRLAKRLENLIKKQLAPMDEDSLVEAKIDPLTPATRTRDTSVTWDATNTMAELHRYLESLDLQLASISASINLQDTSRVFSSSHVYHDMELGEMVEFTTNTPLVCDLRELDTYIPILLSSHKTSLQRPYTRSHVRKPPPTGAHLEHQFTKTFECQFGEILVNVVSVGRKINEPQQIVLAYTSRLELSGTEVAFRETAWLIMKQQSGAPGESQQSDSPSQRVLLQTCHRIYPVTSSGEDSSTPESTEYFKNFILQSQCEEMRAKQLHIQNGTRQKFGSHRATQV